MDQRQHFQQGLPQYPAPPPQQYYQSPAPSGGMPPLFWAIVGGAAVLLFNFFNSIRTAGGIQAWVRNWTQPTSLGDLCQKDMPRFSTALSQLFAAN